MAKRSPSVLKRQRQEEKRRMRNKMIKSRVKTFIKKAKEAILNNQENAEEYLREAIKEIDKAAAKGVIHKNTAARKKSRLMLFYNKYGTKKEENQVNK